MQEGDRWCRKAVTVAGRAAAGAELVAASAGKWSPEVVVAAAGKWSPVQEWQLPLQ